MPCRYYTEAEERQMLAEDSARLKKELDRATKLLCGLLARLPKNSKHVVNDQELLAWRDEHDKMDAARNRKAEDE